MFRDVVENVLDSLSSYGKEDTYVIIQLSHDVLFILITVLFETCDILIFIA